MTVPLNPLNASLTIGATISSYIDCVVELGPYTLSKAQRGWDFGTCVSGSTSTISLGATSQWFFAIRLLLVVVINN
jgi:hypothetical protein